MSLVVGSLTSIDKVDVSIVDKRILELEKRIEDRKKSVIDLYNSKLSLANKSFLEQAKKSERKDEVSLSYFKRVKELHAEFKQKY